MLLTIETMMYLNVNCHGFFTFVNIDGVILNMFL